VHVFEKDCMLKDGWEGNNTGAVEKKSRRGGGKAKLLTLGVSFLTFPGDFRKEKKSGGEFWRDERVSRGSRQEL